MIFESKLYAFQGKAGRWTRHYHLKVPPPPVPPQPPRGGPRQRILPTPRGVNMIVWSLDNRFVLAAIMGNVAMCMCMPIFGFLFMCLCVYYIVRCISSYFPCAL